MEKSLEKVPAALLPGLFFAFFAQYLFLFVISRKLLFLKSVGMPGNFAELGAKEEDIPKLVEVLCRGDGREGSISGFVTLDEEDCTNIYRLML